MPNGPTGRRRRSATGRRRRSPLANVIIRQTQWTLIHQLQPFSIAFQALNLDGCVDFAMAAVVDVDGRDGFAIATAAHTVVIVCAIWVRCMAGECTK